MNAHEKYMLEFEQFYAAMPQLGPGSEQDSLQALDLLPERPETILDIGCGKGGTSLLLAEHSGARITAVDNDEFSLSCLYKTAEDQGMQKQVMPVCACMTELSFDLLFDVVWSEGSAYIMGVEQALMYWKTLIRPGGYLVVSDLVWLTQTPSEECAVFWQQEYPDLVTTEVRISQAQKLGYQLLSTFTLSDQGWDNYMQPMADRIDELSSERFVSEVMVDLRKELEIFQKYRTEYGYQFFILQVK